MTDKTDANLETVYKAIAELAARLDKLEQPQPAEGRMILKLGDSFVAIDVDEPIVPALRRELIGKTLATELPQAEREEAVAVLDALSRKDQADDKRRKAELAKVMQGDWQKNSDAEMFGIEGAKPKLDHILSEIKKEVGFARSKFPGDNVTFAALVEEVGELATATFSQSRIDVRKEAVQVAAMAIRLVLDGDCTFDAWRAKFKLDPLTDRPTGLLTADEMFAESEGRE